MGSICASICGGEHSKSPKKEGGPPAYLATPAARMALLSDICAEIGWPVTVRLLRSSGEETEVPFSVDGTLEGLHAAAARQFNVEQEQVKLFCGSSLLADQGPLADAGVPDF